MADSDDEVRPILGALNPGSETEAGAMLSVSGSVVAEIQGEGMQSNSTSVEGPESFMMNPKRRKVEFSSAAEQMMTEAGAMLSVSGSVAAEIQGEGMQNNSTSSEGPESFMMNPNRKKVEFSSAAEQMMAKMGYKEGTGLGKHEQGRVNIVEASTQRGRRGLGLTVTGFEPSAIEWDFNKEEVKTEETVEWLPQCKEAAPHLNDMYPAWVLEGKRQTSIDHETEFCTKQTLDKVLRCKSVFDSLEGEEMRRARTKSNPYETIRGAIFLNRAAMKMANMDAVLGFMFTNPKDQHGQFIRPDEMLYFADICAGPGGFSEYVLWRRKNDAKGFGFTLKGPCDFKLEDFFAAASDMFEPHYGVGGLDGDGDIYRPDNLREFQTFVLKSTGGRGVHFVMADGGFDVEGKENLQEVLSKRLYLCQSLCALLILRPGGHFVCKLFDIFTPFSVGVIYLMYRAFDRVAVFKPVTSRPANSERYLICQGMRPDSAPVRDYMFTLNEWFQQHWGVLVEEDLREIVPLKKLKQDEQFYQYIFDSNEKLGTKQAIALTKIRTFAQNQDLHEERQSQIREECLKLWNVPDEVRTAPGRVEADMLFQNLVKEEPCLPAAEHLDPDSLSCLGSVYDYRCLVAGTDHTCLLLSRGKSLVFTWDSRDQKGKWSKIEKLKVSIPQDTVLEVEFVEELRGEGKGQKRVTAIHIIDAMFLCGVDIRELHFNERLHRIRKFVKAITRPTRPELAPIRFKDVHRFEEIHNVFQRLEMKVLKGSGKNSVLGYCCEVQPDEVPRFYRPAGVCFIKTVTEPWTMHFSKTNKRKYFFNKKTGESVFHTPPESIASYKCCQQSRRFWTWDDGVKVHDVQLKVDISKVSKQTILDYVSSKR